MQLEVSEMAYSMSTNLSIRRYISQPHYQCLVNEEFSVEFVAYSVGPNLLLRSGSVTPIFNGLLLLIRDTTLQTLFCRTFQRTSPTA